MNQIEIDYNNNNKIINANINELITIKLKENPTTGYRWKLNEFDKKILELLDSKYNALSPGIGGGGMRSFTFNPIEKGKTKIQLTLKREWEKDIEPIDKFIVFIQTS